ncbi:NACHT, LRR and PYD domains-containing protein 6-like [Acanthochromis polyacanthus]|uniref:NACHT, LRR and PYD domains-containing protein 6-like n=1 Tax=Acanthochromis polyacanthus TaxID=80966 RepID=UPI0022348567|nr:NACHT, LRR and PYD domains-containing protein 6-like [Acanthochromis polyacanthus]
MKMSDLEEKDGSEPPASNRLSMKNDKDPPDFRKEPGLSDTKVKMSTPPEVLLETLEDMTAEEFKEFKWFLWQKGALEDFPAIPKCDLENADRMDTVDEMLKTYCVNTMKVTVMVLKKISKNDLVQNIPETMKEPAEILSGCQDKLKSKLKKKFQFVFEGIAKAGKKTLLNEIYTELYVTEGVTAEVSDEHKVRQIEAASRKADRVETSIRPEDIFKGRVGSDEEIRTVMTQGVAGIGKTALTQKLTLDWAEDKSNQDIHFMFPFTFRELNLLKEKKFSWWNLFITSSVKPKQQESAGLKTSRLC